MSEIEAFTLGGEAVAAFDPATGLMSLTDIATCQSITLSRDGQFLLLDALCRYYSFKSPVESIVHEHEVGPSEEALRA